MRLLITSKPRTSPLRGVGQGKGKVKQNTAEHGDFVRRSAGVAQYQRPGSRPQHPGVVPTESHPPTRYPTRKFSIDDDPYDATTSHSREVHQQDGPLLYDHRGNQIVLRRRMGFR